MIVRLKPFLRSQSDCPTWQKDVERHISPAGWSLDQIGSTGGIRRFLDDQLTHFTATFHMVDADIRYTLPVLADAILQNSNKQHHREG